MRFHESLGEKRRRVIDDVKRFPRLQRRHRRVGEDLGDLRKRGVLPHHRAVDFVQPRFLEGHAPRESRSVRLQLGDGHRVVRLVAIPALGARPVRLGDLRLHGHDVRGVLVRVIPADEPQHVGDVLLVSLLLRLEVVAQVELVVGQAEAGLREVERVFLRILGDHDHREDVRNVVASFLRDVRINLPVIGFAST